MPGLAISQRLKVPHPKHLNTFVWRYRRVEEGRGVKTGSLEPPFFVRPTLADGSQPWVELDAQTFDQAKRERDKRERAGIQAEDNELRASGQVCARCGQVITAAQDVRLLPDGHFVHEVCPEANGQVI